MVIIIGYTIVHFVNSNIIADIIKDIKLMVVPNLLSFSNLMPAAQAPK
jgi:hypothetical protein